MNVIEMVEPKEGEEGQWLGVYITRWRQEWDAPTALFREIDVGDVPEVKALVEALRRAEWVERHGNAEGHRACPSCGQWEWAGHDTDCKLAAALAAWE